MHGDFNGAVVHTVASHGPVWSFSVLTRAYVGTLQTLRLPPTVQKHAQARLTCDSKLAADVNMRLSLSQPSNRLAFYSGCTMPLSP